MSSLRTLPVAVLIIAFTWQVGATAEQANPPKWVIDMTHSHLGISMLANGSVFKSEFKIIQGVILFDSDQLDNSLIDVSVPIDSFSSGNTDGDVLAASEEFFATEKWPQAHFYSTTINATEVQDSYRVTGKLKIKGLTKTFSVIMNFSQHAETASLTGKTRLNRLDFNIGTGEWENTDWLSDTVEIQVQLSLKLASTP